MVAAKWYSNGLKNFLAGSVDFEADTIKMALLVNTYTPSQGDEFFSDVSADEASGTGYTAGGDALTTKTNTQTLDAAAEVWASTTAYQVGDVVRPGTANGHVYVCIVAGTSGAGEPGFPTVPRQTVDDDTVTWAEAGSSLVALKSDPVVWTTDAAGLTGAYAVIYQDTGTPATSALLGYIDFEGNETASDADFTVTPDAAGWLRVFAGS